MEESEAEGASATGLRPIATIITIVTIIIIITIITIIIIVIVIITIISAIETYPPTILLLSEKKEKNLRKYIQLHKHLMI